MDVLKHWSSAQPGGPGRPFITYYDVGSGERTELSGTTTGNWVAKTANLLVDEFDAEPGTRIFIGLPTHWLRIVWVITAWTIGADIVEAGADIAVAGPDLDLGPAADAQYRVAASLHPFATPFEEPPAGFVDLGSALPGQPDIFVPFAPPSATGLDALLGAVEPSAERRLLAAGPLERDIGATAAAVRGGGSLVLVNHGSAQDLQQIAAQERAQIT